MDQGDGALNGEFKSNNPDRGLGESGILNTSRADSEPLGTLHLRFHAIGVPANDLSPLLGPYAVAWGAWRAWWTDPDAGIRPSLSECAAALNRYMPELVPLWESLCATLASEPLAACFLSQWSPPPLVRGCSSAVFEGPDPLLIRNYDFDPARFDAMTLSTDWLGRGVLGTADQLWGLLDGVNDAGLAVSLTFGGRRAVGPGFGIPMVLRYLLQVCTTTADAVEVLRHIPVHVPYNVTILDSSGVAVTVYVGPDRSATVASKTPGIVATTNHQEQVDWPEHALLTRSADRAHALVRVLAGPRTESDMVEAMLRPPMYSAGFLAGFGTLYTAVLDPRHRSLAYHWPSTSWSLGLPGPIAGSHDVVLYDPHPPESAPIGPPLFLSDQHTISG